MLTLSRLLFVLLLSSSTVSFSAINNLTSSANGYLLIAHANINSLEDEDEDEPEPEAKPGYDVPTLTKSAAIRKIRYYYDHSGEWASVFRIDRVTKISLVKSGSKRIIAYVKYHYAPIPGNARGRTDSGYDSRKFILKYRDGDWIVTNMGGYQSGR